jgi:hypothetical protein
VQLVEKPVYIEVPVEKVMRSVLARSLSFPLSPSLGVRVCLSVCARVCVVCASCVQEVEKIVYKDKNVYVDKMVEVEKVVYVDKPVEKQVKVNNPELVELLNMPQAPVILSQSGFQWLESQSDSIIVQVAHSQRNGWQRPCPVTLFVTVDGSEPSHIHHHFVGLSPLTFMIDRSLTVRAVALSDSNLMSCTVEEKFTKLQTAGVGLLLEKMNNYSGIYVQEVVPGGSAWQDGNLLEGDEITEIDGVVVRDMELPAITKLIVGPLGSQVC